MLQLHSRAAIASAACGKVYRRGLNKGINLYMYINDNHTHSRLYLEVYMYIRYVRVLQCFNAVTLCGKFMCFRPFRCHSFMLACMYSHVYECFPFHVHVLRMLHATLKLLHLHSHILLEIIMLIGFWTNCHLKSNSMLRVLQPCYATHTYAAHRRLNWIWEYLAAHSINVKVQSHELLDLFCMLREIYAHKR